MATVLHTVDLTRRLSLRSIGLDTTAAIGSLRLTKSSTIYLFVLVFDVSIDSLALDGDVWKLSDVAIGTKSDLVVVLVDVVHV